MVFVGLFLKSIFLILLLSAFFFIGIILYLYVRVKKMAKTFNTKSTKHSTNESKQSWQTNKSTTNVQRAKPSERYLQRMKANMSTLSKKTTDMSNYTNEAITLLQKLIKTPSVSRDEKDAADIMRDISKVSAWRRGARLTTYGPCHHGLTTTSLPYCSTLISTP